MKGLKGKLLKKLKSIPTGYLISDRVLQVIPTGYLIPDRVLQVINASDGSIQDFPNRVSCEEAERINIKQRGFAEQESDIVDISELIRDLEDQEIGFDDKENIGFIDNENIGVWMNHKDRVPMKANLEASRSSSNWEETPLPDIDISSFQRPDLNSLTLFDPKLLQAFHQAVSEHFRISEEHRKFERRGIKTRPQQPEEELEEPPPKSPQIDNENDNNYNPLLLFEEKCPPRGNESVILYMTSLRGIRKTFEDCQSIRFLLQSFRVAYQERDVSMHMEFKEQLWEILGGKAVPPKLFIKGRHIGGAEVVLNLHEQGKLRPLFNGVPVNDWSSPCEGCAGFRFVLCSNCSGSHKIVKEDDGLFGECEECNENGLLVCPICC